jgi:hypothetical protein
VPEQEALQMSARLARNPDRRCPRPHQITHRLMSRIRHPNRRQFARPMAFCQHEGIAAVGLCPVSGLYRNERRGDDHAIMPGISELPVKTIAAGAGLMADVQQASVAAQLRGKLADMVGAVRDRAPVANVAAPSPMRE